MACNIGVCEKCVASFHGQSHIDDAPNGKPNPHSACRVDACFACLAHLLFSSACRLGSVNNFVGRKHISARMPLSLAVPIQGLANTPHIHVLLEWPGLVNGKETLEHNIQNTEQTVHNSWQTCVVLPLLVPVASVKSARVQSWRLTSDSRNAVPVARLAASSLFRAPDTRDKTSRRRNPAALLARVVPEVL